jgi:hypothetical protein
MKGIYLTEEGKKDIQSKIDELKKYSKTHKSDSVDVYYSLKIYKEILSSATILPVEESWKNIETKNKTFLTKQVEYPKGVIIKPESV